MRKTMGLMWNGLLVDFDKPYNVGCGGWDPVLL